MKGLEQFPTSWDKRRGKPRGPGEALEEFLGVMGSPWRGFSMGGGPSSVLKG